MSPAQIELLRRCVEADRSWRSQKERGLIEDVSFRGVEVGAINGVNPRTAEALAQAGLVELVTLFGRHAYAFLGKYAPFDDEAFIDAPGRGG